MAISKILHINPHMNSETYHLKTGLNYITKSEKTMNGLYVGAVNCMVENAYECMRTTKEIYGKTDKRQAYHLIISFEEGETNPETAFEIIKEFVNRYLADNYEAVYSVHNDTDHIHGHIIWNSVRFTDGYKYRYEKGDWERQIQPLVDEICDKYGLHTLEQNKAKDDEKEWDVSKNGPFVWNEQIKKDVDECIIMATDFDMFIQMMEEKDYTIKYGKYISVKPKGMERFRRLKTLGENYSEEMIRKRISQKSIAEYKHIDMPKELRIKSYRGHIRKKRLTGLQKQYFAILYKLKKIKKRSYSNNYKYKDDIFPFYDNTKGKTITLVVQMDDEQGLLSDLLHVVAVYRANILTIHQSIPVNGVATLTLSVEVRDNTGNVSSMIDELEELEGIHYVKILARE